MLTLGPYYYAYLNLKKKYRSLPFHVFAHKVLGAYVVILLYQTPNFVCYIALLVVMEDGDQKDIRYDEIGLCVNIDQPF